LVCLHESHKMAIFESKVIAFPLVTLRGMDGFKKLKKARKNEIFEERS